MNTTTPTLTRHPQPAAAAAAIPATAQGLELNIDTVGKQYRRGVWAVRDGWRQARQA